MLIYWCWLLDFLLADLVARIPTSNPVHVLRFLDIPSCRGEAQRRITLAVTLGLLADFRASRGLFLINFFTIQQQFAVEKSVYLSDRVTPQVGWIKPHTDSQIIPRNKGTQKDPNPILAEALVLSHA